MRCHLPSMRRLMAMRCPSGAQTGSLSVASTREPFTCVGRPTVVEVPTVSISGSLVRSASTRLLPVPFTLTSASSRSTLGPSVVRSLTV